MSNIIKTESFKIVLTYNMTINTDTGEILDTKLIDRQIINTDLKPSKKSSSLEVQEDIPALFLEENKYKLTQAAINLMGVENDDKILIKYESTSSGTIPIIGTSKAFGVKGGNKLSQVNTVVYRGKNREELAKYGTEFTLKPHSSKEGLFILISSDVPEISNEGDENIQIPEDTSLSDFDLNELIDNEDSQVTEIKSNMFQF